MSQIKFRSMSGLSGIHRGCVRYKKAKNGTLRCAKFRKGKKHPVCPKGLKYGGRSPGLVRPRKCYGGKYKTSRVGRKSRKTTRRTARRGVGHKRGMKLGTAAKRCKGLSQGRFKACVRALTKGRKYKGLKKAKKAHRRAISKKARRGGRKSSRKTSRKSSRKSRRGGRKSRKTSPARTQYVYTRSGD